MARYGLATILEDCPIGYEFAPDNIPLHLTHVDSFEVDLSPQDLEAKLRQLLANQNSFTVGAVVDEWYGPEKDIPVTTLEISPELKKLHNSLMDFLDSEGALLKNPHFHGDNFSPHISVYGSRRVFVGEQVPISSISIGTKVSDAEGANHCIVATIAFRKSY